MLEDVHLRPLTAGPSRLRLPKCTASRGFGRPSLAANRLYDDEANQRILQPNNLALIFVRFPPLVFTNHHCLHPRNQHRQQSFADTYRQKHKIEWKHQPKSHIQLEQKPNQRETVADRLIQIRLFSIEILQMSFPVEVDNTVVSDHSATPNGRMEG